MRIVHVLSGLGVGGAEGFLRDLILATRSSLDHVVIVVGSDLALAPDIRATGVPVHALGHQTTLSWPRAFREVSALVQGLSPDIVQGWMAHGNVLAYAAAKACRRRPSIVFTIRSTLDSMRHERLSTRLATRLGAARSAKADLVVYNSHRGRITHEAYGYSGARVEVIGNGVDERRFAPSSADRRRERSRLGFDTDQMVIGRVGRRHPMKGTREFAEVLRMVRKEVGVEAVWIGPKASGPAGRRGTSDLGRLPGLRLMEPESFHAAMFNAFDLTLSPSIYGESYPNAVAESWSSGVPCVTTDVGDSAALVPESRFVVAPGGSDAMAAEVIRILRDGPEHMRRMGAIGRTKILAQHTRARAVAAWTDLYREQVDASP